MMFHLVDAVGITTASSITLLFAVAYGVIFTALSLLACAAIAYACVRAGDDGE